MRFYRLVAGVVSHSGWLGYLTEHNNNSWLQEQRGTTEAFRFILIIRKLSNHLLMMMVKKTFFFFSKTYKVLYIVVNSEFWEPECKIQAQYQVWQVWIDNLTMR